jgi:hypothetical protein
MFKNLHFSSVMCAFGDQTNNALWDGSYLSLSKNGFNIISILFLTSESERNSLSLAFYDVTL